MKKLALLVILLFAMSGIAMASPLTDYSKGNAALDINYRNNSSYDATVGADGVGSVKGEFDGDNNGEWGFTYGIGNNWALQYRQATPKGTLGFTGPSEEPQFMLAEAGNDTLNLQAKTRVEEYNVLYKLDKSISLFTGVVRATPSLRAGIETSDFGVDLAVQGHNKNIWQFGVLASTPVANRLTAYGVAAFGSDYHNWEAGLGYDLGKDVELNVNYRHMKIEDMTALSASIPEGNYTAKTDTKVKGWGFGVTYKF